MNKNRRLLQQCLIENMGLVIVLLALSILISILSLTVPWFMQYFTDTVVIGGAWENVRTVTGAFLVIILLRFAIDLMYERLMAYLIFQKITLSLRKRIEHILIYMKCRYLYKKKEEIAEKDIETILLGRCGCFQKCIIPDDQIFYRGAETDRIPLRPALLFIACRAGGVRKDPGILYRFQSI